MGQSITVTEKRGLRHDVARFELNRSLTGMGHEVYRSRADAVGERPPDELARRLFDRGGIDSVHVYSNVVTVDLAPGADTAGLSDLIRDLFLYYRAPEVDASASSAEQRRARSSGASSEGVTPPPI